jgi:hypothetical protein
MAETGSLNHAYDQKDKDEKLDQGEAGSGIPPARSDSAKPGFSVGCSTA